MIQKFRTRPVEIEAILFTGYNHKELYQWTDGDWDWETESDNMFGQPVNFTAHLWDKFHETWISVEPGMWIVKDAKGRFYHYDSETFLWKYEEIVPAELKKQEKCRYEGNHQGTVCFSDGDVCRSCGWTL